jgi:2,3-bisphosphoglycerate-independent phosphoglycerate mutase
MTAHLSFMATNLARNAPMVMGALEKNCFEHISLMAQEQVEVEMKNEMQQLQMMGQQLQTVAQQNPQAAQQLQIQVRMLSEQIESRKAVLIAEMMEEFMKEEQKITSQFDNDPIAKLKARELDLQAQENRT